MQHFFVAAEQRDGNVIWITGPDVNHIKNVLRMKQGDRLVVSDGEDQDYYCVITEITAEHVTVSVEEAAEAAELPARLYLFQGLPKSDKMERIIQKAVELGAHQIIPVAMKRSVVKLDEKKQKSRIARWNGIAVSAAKQSGRGMIPVVTGVMTMDEVLKAAEKLNMLLVPYENASGMEATREALALVKAGMDIGILIGPEGGFDPEEIERLQKAGARTVSLGRRILRTETAGLSALTLCMYQLELRTEVED